MINYEQAIFYNEASAQKLGWSPQWFGCGEFDEDLVDAIVRFQNEHSLGGDGKCGPNTYRRAFTERESEIDHHKPSFVEKEENFIVYGGNFIPIKDFLKFQKILRNLLIKIKFIYLYF